MRALPVSQIGKSHFFRSKPLSLSVISIPPASGQPPTGLIVVLHGFGGNAQELATLAPLLNLSDYQLFFPNAPFAHPYGDRGRMWYDLGRSPSASQEDYQDLVQSRQQLTDWLKSLETKTGVPLSRTILAGFSQGGAMTMDVGLNMPLAGLIVLSGYLHPISGFSNSSVPPVLVVHGRRDTVVPLRAAQYTQDTLTALGVAVQYQEFDMGHEIQPAVLPLIQSFVARVMSKASETA